MKKYQLELNEKEMESVASIFYYVVHYLDKGLKGKSVELDKKLLKKVSKMYPMKKIRERYKSGGK